MEEINRIWCQKIVSCLADSARIEYEYEYHLIPDSSFLHFVFDSFRKLFNEPSTSSFPRRSLSTLSKMALSASPSRSPAIWTERHTDQTNNSQVNHIDSNVEQ